MDKDQIYRKTAAGQEAIATRSAALGPRQRSLLIMVDGRRSVGELAAIGDTGGLLEQLLALGCIELVSQPVVAAAAPAARPALPLAQLKSRAVRRLTELLGPTATDLCLRLEAARSAEEFQAAVRRTEATLRQVLGPQKAAGFAQEMENPGPA